MGSVFNCIGMEVKVAQTNKQWYVVHAFSGMEKTVLKNLEERIKQASMADSFGKILVPVEEVVEIRKGQKSISERRFFPGYVLVEMEMNEQTWHLVKNTDKVTGFVGGSSSKPSPISEREVNKIMAQMKEGVEKEIVLPKSLIKKVVPQLASIAFTNLENHLFYGPIRELPENFSEEDKMRLTAAYTSMIEDKVKPAYQQIHDFMKGEYMETGRLSSGFDAYSFGEEYYDYAIQLYTTTSMSAEEIHELGLREVARLRSEMQKVKKQVGFSGDLNSFFDHVRTLPQLVPFDDPQQVIDNFNAIHDKMKANVDRLFSLQPKTAFEVRRTEAFREKSASAEYSPGSLDGTRPGIFYVPIPDVTKYNIFSDEDLFLHEAIPGHHFQIALQQENTGLPDFRKTLWYSSYGEGWALYCESLGKELGLYDDPYQYFGMLSAEMHRAIRLVVDTGLHTKGWTREDAIAYSLANEAEPEAAIISEIERYMANPGQALSYKIGQLKILELRENASQKLADHFSISTFHEKILETGCIPLALLEEKIHSWTTKSFN